MKVYESYPGLPGEGERWEQFLSENGRPRPASKLKELRDRQKKAEALAREATEQPEKLQAQQQRKRRLLRGLLSSTMFVRAAFACGRLPRKSQRCL